MLQTRLGASGSDRINVTPAEDDIYDALKGWLTSILPSDYKIFTRQTDDTPLNLPRSVLIQLTKKRLYATCSERDGADNKTVLRQPVLTTIRSEIYQDGAGDAATLISTLWRHGDADLWFRPTYPDVSACGSADIQRDDWVDAAGHRVETWVLDLMLDVQSSTILTSESALALHSAMTAADNINNNKDPFHG